MLWLWPQGWLLNELSFWKQCWADRSMYTACERHMSTVCSTDSCLSAMWHLITHSDYDPLTSDAFLYLGQCNGRKLLWSRKMQQDIGIEISASVYHLINLFLPVPAKLNIWHYLLSGQGKLGEHKDHIHGKKFWEMDAGFWALFYSWCLSFLRVTSSRLKPWYSKTGCSQLFLMTLYSWEIRKKRQKQTASCMFGRGRKKSENSSASRRNYGPVIWSNSFK